jgi:hypothetical protein
VYYFLVIVKVNAKLPPEDAESLGGMTAELWDADLGRDASLSTSRIDSEGNVEFIFHLSQVQGRLSPLEMFPDLYLTVKSDSGDLVFISETVRNVSFFEKLELSGQGKTTLDIEFPPLTKE